VSRAAALLLALAPAAAGALEPRFDHRDQLGPSVELLAVSDTVSVPGGTSHTTLAPGLRIAFGMDVAGEGNELVLAARLAWPRPDPARERVRVALDLRYRAYFGLDEWKTFLDVGLFAPLSSRLGAGPLVGLGFAYDFGRTAGLYAAASLGTAFGSARTASIAVGAGAQLRF
jgi:hypothetical protein